MNNIYSHSDPEKLNNLMEWVDNSNTEKLRTRNDGGSSSVNPSFISGCISSEAMSYHQVGRKRKTNFSSPLAKKISRNICEEIQQKEIHLTINKIDLHLMNRVVSDLNIPSSESQMILSELYDNSSPFSSDYESELSISDSEDSSNCDISVYAISKSCATACQSRICNADSDHEMVANEIPSHTEDKAIYRKGNVCASNLYQSRWLRGKIIRKHLASRAPNCRSPIKKHTSIQEDGRHLRCLNCRIYLSAQTHHEIWANSSDSDV